MTAVLAIIVCQAVGTAQQVTESRHIMWRVESDSTVIYLLGSVHALPPDAYPLDAIIEKSFDSCSRLALELDLSSSAMPDMQAALMSKGMFKGKEGLADYLSKETYDLLSEALRREGLDIRMFARFKPWVVGMLLMTLDLQKAGLEFQSGVDAYFQKRAETSGKTTLGLERVDDQIVIFDSMSASAQEEFVRQQLLDDSTSGKQLQGLVDAWRRGDVDLLAAELEDEMGSPELYERMVTRRNRNWMSTIESFLMLRDRTMVVVGALHLVGKDGIVEMLRQRGYRIEQL